MEKACKERIISCVVNKPQIDKLQTDKRFCFAFSSLVSILLYPFSVSGIF